ncbi:MAG: hypothetical protein ACREJC_22565, partial [Tepidisphaeraceae bacterium]
MPPPVRSTANRPKPSSFKPVATVRTGRAWSRWAASAGLSLTTVALFSLSLAPIHQFYLAWVALVPWLILLHGCRTKRGAFFWSWFTGTLFFAVNMWWLIAVSAPGAVALVGWLGLFWGVTGLIIRWCRLLPEPSASPLGALRSIVMIAATWTASEWMRGNFSILGEHGLPWLFLGHTQSPFLVACQIADLGGACMVSFWAAL